MKSDLYVISFDKTVEISDFNGLQNFLQGAVLRNRDVSSFSVTCLRTTPIPLTDVPTIVEVASKRGIILNGGEICGKNFDKMYLYEDAD